jgi:HlyD family secretion protein
MSKIKNFFLKIIKNKKYLVIFVLIIGGLSWFFYAKFFNQNNSAQYVLAEAKKGTINISVSGTGFVIPETQISIKSKVSGDVVFVGVKEGQKVKKGDLILKLDTSDIEKNVRDAEIVLENAKLSLEKLKKQYDEAQRADSLNKYYEDGMSLISNFYNDYPSIFDGLKKIIFNRDFPTYSGTNIEYYADFNLQKFSGIYYKADTLKNEIEKLYPQAFADFNLAKRGAGEQRKKAIDEAYELLLKISELNKLTRDPVLSLQNQLVLDEAIHLYKNIIDRHANSLNSYYQTLDNYLKNILVIVNNINSYNDNLSSYPLDIKNQQLVVLQRENALKDAKDKLSDYYIRAPLNGIIADFSLNVGDSISPIEVAKLITENKIAQISLNELDAANISVSQKAKLTFDAFPNLVLEGTVSEISTLGEESNGVVSYNVKINFEDKENKIKPGMSVTAEIIVNSKENVLLLPSAAIKSKAGKNYVLKIEDKNILAQNNFNKIKTIKQSALQVQPKETNIEVGVTDNEFTEIKSGLEEGDIVVLREINQSQNNGSSKGNSSGSANASQSPASFRVPGASSR